MSALSTRYAQFHCEAGFIARKTFGSGRAFTVLVAGAETHGIAGTELNGLAVLDEDNKAIVLDRHLPAPAGAAPSAEQKAEFARVVGMGWLEFSAFCRTNGRYREGVATDVDAGGPPADIGPLDQAIASGRLGSEGPDIRLPDMVEAHAGHDVGYAFPLKTRQDMIVHLSRHSRYPVPGGGFVLEWNIKVGDADFSGKSGSEEVDPEFDEKWEKFAEEDPYLFPQACADALSPYLEGDYTTCSGEDQGSHEFYTDGRSGGHLCLKAWRAGGSGTEVEQLKFASRSGYVGWLKGLPEQELAAFYRLVACVDADTSRPGLEIANQYNLVRAGKEEEWSMELENERLPSP